jgi:hypothetical protein
LDWCFSFGFDVVADVGEDWTVVVVVGRAAGDVDVFVGPDTALSAEVGFLVMVISLLR